MVELESEGELARHEVAEFLREFANEIDDGVLDAGADPTEGDVRDEGPEPEADTATKQITFIVGGDSATVTVPDTVEFDVEVASRSPLFSSRASQKIELDLSWEIEETDAPSDDRIQIG